MPQMTKIIQIASVIKMMAVYRFIMEANKKAASQLFIWNAAFVLYYDVTYDTSNSARHGFWKSPFCHAARYLCTSFPFVLGCNFLLHQFPGFLVNDCGMGISNIALPNSSIVFHRFMVQEIWCISFLKQGIAHIFLVCENTIRPITEDDKKTYWDR